MKQQLINIALIALTHPVFAGTEIIVNEASTAIFPEQWRASPINAEAELLPEDRQPDLRKLIKKTLDLYPSRVLDESLKKVYVLGRIRYSGVVAGGSNSKNVVYVVSSELYSEQRLIGNFHAEYSSILLRNHPEYLDQEAWKAQNPEGFVYLGSGVQAVLENKSSLRLSDTLHEQGFLHEYGKASVEEDFNSFAARLWTGDNALWNAINKFQRIKAKADLAIAFYTRLHSSLNHDFFHKQPRTEMK